MIELLMRKILYGKYSKEAQKLLYEIDGKRDFIEFIVYYSFRSTILYPIILLFVIEYFNNFNLTITSHLIGLVLVIIYLICYLVIYIFFKREIFIFLKEVSNNLFFNIYTLKGKALTKKDFLDLRKKNKTVFKCIYNKACRGYCYWTCFEICKGLKKGSIEIIALPNCSKKQREEYKYIVHVIYVNNGYCFDTNTAMQYPIKEYYNKNEAIKMLSYDIEIIKNKSFFEFKTEYEKEIGNICELYNCKKF